MSHHLSRLPLAVKHGLTLLGGVTLAQLIPALASPLITRLFVPSVVGAFAFTTAVFSVLAPLACLRYDIAIVLPEDEEEAARLTALCFVIGAAAALLSVASLLLISHAAAHSEMRTAASLLLVMLPMCIVLLSFHLVGQSWSLRLHRYELQSRALIAQALVTVMAQVGLIPLLGATAYTLVLGYLAGYIALMVVYLPVIRNPIVLYLQKHHSHQGLLEAARSYLRFPLYAGPYAVLGQVSLRVVVLALAAFSTAGIVGQYAVAQRVTFLPVMALMGAASQVFYSRAARRLDDPRMPHMVRTVLVVGPMVVGPFFVLLILFGEPLFAIVFGPAWRQAGHFAAILAVPSLVTTLTAWLDRTFDIRSRQGLPLMLEVGYLGIVCVSTYAALRIWKDPELAIVLYAGVTVVYLLVWMTCALVVAGFPSRLAFQFIVVTASVIAFMLGIDSLITWVGASEPIRFACALLLALLLAAAGLWLGKERMRSMEQLAR